MTFQGALVLVDTKRNLGLVVGDELISLLMIDIFESITKDARKCRYLDHDISTREGLRALYRGSKSPRSFQIVLGVLNVNHVV